MAGSVKGNKHSPLGKDGIFATIRGEYSSSKDRFGSYRECNEPWQEE